MYTILGVIARPLGWLLGLLYDFISYYGITIILFTLIVKLCLYPLYIKQTKSMAKMSAVQPKMQAIQRKYANDRETMNIKMAELYKEEKFNPMGGCLPMLIQMPIIMGLFALLRNPMQYMGNDSSMIFAFHESFVWINDFESAGPVDTADNRRRRHIHILYDEPGSQRHRFFQSTDESDEWYDEDDEIYLPYHDIVDGKIVSVGTCALLGCQPDNTDIL